MPNIYQDMLERCQRHSDMTERLVDNYLIYYAAAKAGLDKKMDQLIKPIRHATKMLPSFAVNVFKSEYIAIQLFRKNGLLNRYIKHSEIRAFPAEDYQFLQQQLQHPWRFSYAVIQDSPAPDFYQMLDVFTFEEYLLYSPGMTKTLEDMHKPVKLWCSLINFNGQCWQTYGVIQAFQSFEPNDIYFFATELYPNLGDETALMSKIEGNPWPFFMLTLGSEFPVVVSDGHEMVFHSATEEVGLLPVEQLKQVFSVRWNKGVYELLPKVLPSSPHFAKAYYEEATQTLHRFAMTTLGFDVLTAELTEKGVAVDPEPFIEVGITMISTTEKILRRKMKLNPYEHLFEPIPSAQETERITQLNHLLSLALPLINEDKPLDIEKLAAEANVNPDTAKQILEQVLERLKKLRGMNPEPD